MEAKEIIIDILQQSLTGQLKPDSNVNPAHIADAIGTMVSFNRSPTDNKHIAIAEKINEFKKEMVLSLDNTKEDLLANFIRGKITAYEEITKLL